MKTQFTLAKVFPQKTCFGNVGDFPHHVQPFKRRLKKSRLGTPVPEPDVPTANVATGQRWLPTSGTGDSNACKPPPTLRTTPEGLPVSAMTMATVGKTSYHSDCCGPHGHPPTPTPLTLLA